MQNLSEESFSSLLEKTEFGKKYLKLIEKAREERSLSVFERHHIHPKALGGSDRKANLVKLSVFEHCLAHAYLALAFPCPETLTPIGRMALGKQAHRLSDLEQLSLENLVEWSQLREKALHSKLSKEHVKAISLARRGQEGNSKGTTWMHSEEKNIRVRVEDVDKRLEEGYKLGRTQDVSEHIREKALGRPSPLRGRHISAASRERSSKTHKELVAIHREDTNRVTWVKKDRLQEYLDAGWKLGRNFRHTKETREKMSRSRAGKESRRLQESVWVNKDGEGRRILEKDLNEFLSKGWKKGMNTKGRACIYREGEHYIRVPKSDLEKYLAEGWKFYTKVPDAFASSGGTKNRVGIHKEGTNLNKYVKLEDLEKYLAEGWIKGIVKIGKSK